MTIVFVWSYETFKPLGIIMIWGWLSTLNAVIYELMKEVEIIVKDKIQE